jgi:hypothetical protein
VLPDHHHFFILSFQPLIANDLSAGNVVLRNYQKDIFILSPRARTMLVLSIPAIVIDIAASLTAAGRKTIDACQDTGIKPGCFSLPAPG